MTSVPPALPWAASTSDAVVQPEGDAQAADELEVAPISLQEVGLQIGDKIEVCWVVEVQGDDEDAPPAASTRWWNATIEAAPPTAPTTVESTTATVDAIAAAPPPAASATTSQPEHSYVLAYEAYESFEASRNSIFFTAQHELYDFEQQDTMHWRRPGEAYEPPEVSDEDDDVVAEIEDPYDKLMASAAAGGTVSTDELLNADAASRRLRGDSSTLEEDELGFLKSVPEHARRVVAEGYRSFVDGIKEMIRQKADATAQGENVVIDGDDIKNLTSMMRAAKRQRM